MVTVFLRSIGVQNCGSPLYSQVIDWPIPQMLYWLIIECPGVADESTSASIRPFLIPERVIHEYTKAV